MDRSIALRGLGTLMLGAIAAGIREAFRRRRESSPMIRNNGFGARLQVARAGVVAEPAHAFMTSSRGAAASASTVGQRPRNASK